MKITLINIIVFLLATIIGQAQVFPEKGVPLIKNFPPSQYLNKGKVWDISSSPNGIVYMASDNGLLEYDGMKWNSFNGSKGVTRSVLVINDSLLYTGSDLDFGVWVKNEYNKFEYTSLYPFKDDVQDVFEEFWNIYQLKDIIVFVSSQNIYIYKNEQITKLEVQKEMSASFVYNDTLFFSEKDFGLYYFDKISLKLFVKYHQKNISIIGMYNQNNKTTFVSKNSGLFNSKKGELHRIDSYLSNFLKDAKVFSFENIDSSHLAFGTILKGLIITDKNENVIHYINKVKGLLSNTILALNYSPSGKLWLGMDYGVASIFLHNKYTYFYDYLGNFGTGSDAKLIGNDFYLGTNQGLYKCSWSDLNDNIPYANFKLISGTEGQVWNLSNIDNTLFICHDHGLFSLKNDKLVEISKKEGVLSIISLEDYLLTGTYNGISIYNKNGDSWRFLKKMDLISGSCKQLLLQNENTLWINIPNYGVIKADLGANFILNSREIFPVDSFKGTDLELVLINDTLNVVTDSNQYFFNSNTGDFHLAKYQCFNSKPENILSGIFKPKPLNNKYAFYPIYNGFAFEYLNNQEYNLRNNYKPIIRNAKAYGNENQQNIINGSIIPYKFNSIRINYIVPNQNDVLYQYRFDNEENWSKWTSKNMVEILGINYGEYNFQLRSKIDGKISTTSELSFTIDKPWRLSYQAYILYFVILLVIAILSRIRHIHVLKKEQQKMLISKENSIKELTEKHNQELILLEQERIKNEFEQIKQQLRIKTVELANKSKENEDKNRLLISIQDKFTEMQKQPMASKRKLNEIRRLLDTYLNVEDNTFEIQMNELHQEFFKKIKDKYPNLSNNDLRLCAYVKVGLNAKEVAEILNIRPSSSYISRSRLRKKLKLKTEDDLYDFLNKF